MKKLRDQTKLAKPSRGRRRSGADAAEPATMPAKGSDRASKAARPAARGRGGVSLTRFTEDLAAAYPLLAPGVADNRALDPETFDALGGRLCDWAQAHLGDAFPVALREGYAHFVADVNLSQAKYERRGHYANKSYAEVEKAVYGNPAHMQFYHWGVYATTFAWAHHLAIYRFFQQRFLSRLPQHGRLIDFGCGSGVWSFLSTEALPDWSSTGVDISETSIGIATGMAASMGVQDRVEFVCADATAIAFDEPFDAGVCCFLVEHLENPVELLTAFAGLLKPRVRAFVTGAISAAEVDHIYEMTHESEAVLLLEKAGLRVVELLSSSPPDYPATRRFLPRSFAAIVERRANDIW